MQPDVFEDLHTRGSLPTKNCCHPLFLVRVFLATLIGFLTWQSPRTAPHRARRRRGRRVKEEVSGKDRHVDLKGREAGRAGEREGGREG